MTRAQVLTRMSSMRTVWIAAIVAMGALRIMWRALNPADSLAFKEERIADE